MSLVCLSVVISLSFCCHSRKCFSYSCRDKLLLTLFNFLVTFVLSPVDSSNPSGARDPGVTLFSDVICDRVNFKGNYLFLTDNVGIFIYKVL